MKRDKKREARRTLLVGARLAEASKILSKWGYRQGLGWI